MRRNIGRFPREFSSYHGSHNQRIIAMPDITVCGDRLVGFCF
jgi:hypothetical protein